MTAFACRFAVLAALLAALPLCEAAQPSDTAASAPAVTPSDKSAVALRNQRLRKCKAMTGDEKTACQRDARTVSAAKARRDARNAGATAK